MSSAPVAPRWDGGQTIFVDGSWIGGAATYERFDPSDTSRSTGRYAAATPEDVGRAYDAASAAQPSWAARTAVERGEVLTAAAEVLARDLERAARRLTADIGKPIRDARGEVLRAVATLRYYAGELLQPSGQNYPSAAADTMLMTVEQPLGIICAITPWNFPAAIPIFKLAPAIGFGNAVVWKPAEAASGSAVLLAEAFEQAGLPAGVLNLVTGRGSELSAALMGDQRLRGVTFTGSNAVGASIRQAVADRNVRVQLEMGGKNPAIVLRDADLRDAANQVTRAAMIAAGQRCTATSRVYVDRPVAEEFLAYLREAVESLVVGDPFDETTDVGPLASDAQAATVGEYLEIAAREHATIVAGDGAAPIGCFVRPTVLANVDPDSRLVREEIFGPVLVVEEVDGLDAALERANSSEYGLASAVFTRDLGAALEFVRRTESGLVCVNRETTGIESHVPFGGMKASSSLSRELGKAARDFFTVSKTVYMRVPPAGG
ncbi:unannotated protein [freshwater metagenome]|uniref:Unannotated protein n=1 Tax=freshwater metagenome TaxID=449393 RepID=A0A6J7D0L2_9ZZZZ|nr:aldehyde dehydrogenase family protein [Actinomycetota bacterium]